MVRETGRRDIAQEQDFEALEESVKTALERSPKQPTAKG